MTFAVSTWSEPPPRSTEPRRTNAAPRLFPAQDWLIGAVAVIAVVFAASLDASRGITVGASIVAAAAIGAALVPWLWTAWLERRTDVQIAWRLTLLSLAILTAAQVASTAVVIADHDRQISPVWIDLLRLAGVCLAVVATVVTIYGRPHGDDLVMTFLVPGLISTGVTAALFVVVAASTSQTLSDSFFAWLLASAIVTLPLSAALIWWSAVLHPQTSGTLQSARMAAGWSCLLVALTGAALDRVLTAHLVSPRTDWAMLPAAALLSTTAIHVLEGRLTGPRGGALAPGSTERDGEAGARGWAREAAPYLIVAASFTFAIVQIRDDSGIGSAIAAAVASVVGTLILVRQVATQTANARAARRLERTRLELATQARVDPVTGLPNRRALDDRLFEEVERALRYKQPLSFCFIDLDHFKTVNDDHGHPAGDVALYQLGAVLRRTARGIDFVGRFGGEEFVVLVPGTWSEDAAILGERLRRAVAETTFDFADGRSVRLSISVGVAGLPEHALDAESLKDCADKALYAAKRAGRNRVVLFEPDS